MNDPLDRLRRRAALLLAGCLFVVALPAAAAGTVKVDYENAQGYTDLGDRVREPTDRERAAILAQFTTFLEKRAGPRIPDGSTLTIEVADIDRAGGFEVWRGPEADHIRFMKDIYPPRIRLSFALVDANGATLSAGDRDLRDQSYLLVSVPDRMDPLRYEKRMLGRWIDSDFRK